MQPTFALTTIRNIVNEEAYLRYGCLRLLKDDLVGESEHVNARIRHSAVSASVFYSCPLVVATVNLNNKPYFRTPEVNNPPEHNGLTSEPKPPALLLPEKGP